MVVVLISLSVSVILLSEKAAGDRLGPGPPSWELSFLATVCASCIACVYVPVTSLPVAVGVNFLQQLNYFTIISHHWFTAA